MTDPIINQHHSGSGDNIVNLGPKRFELTDDIVRSAVAEIGIAKSVEIHSYGDLQEANRLISALRSRGFNISHASHSFVASPPPPPGIAVAMVGDTAMVDFNPA